MMNVPLAVIMGKSPMKTVCSLISPVSLLMKAAVTKRGREKVMSFSLHSSSSNLESSKRCPRNWSARLPVKSSIGEISLRISFRPSLRKLSNDSFWTAIRLGGGRTSASFAKVRRSRSAFDDKQHPPVQLLARRGRKGPGKPPQSLPGLVRAHRYGSSAVSPVAPGEDSGRCTLGGS
jgi:hypothetical protein